MNGNDTNDDDAGQQQHQEQGVTNPPGNSHNSNNGNIHDADNNNSASTDGAEILGDEKAGKWKVFMFVSVLFFDLVSLTVLFFPLISSIESMEGISVDGGALGVLRNYSFSRTVYDIGILGILRVFLAFLSLTGNFGGYISEENYRNLYHPNGEKKSREELDMEALEESFYPWFKRFIKRPSFSCEVFCVITQIFCVVKCFVRMEVEMGEYEDKHRLHPLFWLAIMFTTFASVIEATFVQYITKLCKKFSLLQYTCCHCCDSQNQQVGLLRRIGSNLAIPLLSDTTRREDDDNDNDVEDPSNVDEQDTENESNQDQDENFVASSDITADCKYKANWVDLLHICLPDLHYICLAFVFLLFAAVAQVYIPKLTGLILDSLTETYDKDSGDDDNNDSPSIFQVKGFISNVKLLILTAILGGVFSGLRGSIFTLVGGRVNVRLRMQLMDALLCQEIGFFDTTKTGDITSRLSSDTTLVGDQVTLNVNVFLRSLVQAIGVLICMFSVSWQLSIVAFISVPVITVLSRWYGEFLRSLTKLMQKKLADGNAVSEATLSSMRTVHAFDAAQCELDEFQLKMGEYLKLNVRACIAYSGYATVVTALPQLVIAIVVFYGGLLVRNGDMSSGQLVSFILYLQSLSDAFASIGYIFSALTQAVGAADKVFELIHRKPKIKVPSSSVSPHHPEDHEHIENETQMLQGGREDSVGFIRGISNAVLTNGKVAQARRKGLRPEICKGDIVFDGVEMHYPSRPKRRILNGLSMKVNSGSVVALVGQSGGGKTSVFSLLQHLYDNTAGKVLLDGIDVHELNPSWLARNVSIVSQEPTLFAKSIKRNIIYGLENTDREPSDEEIIEAARLANADSFIQTLPLGYDTECGERGVQLSGGQKQRIAIARALVRKPKVLLLDEATSALDSESEHMVQKAIDEMICRGKTSSAMSNGEADFNPGMTVMIIAHRLSTVRNADTIFVIQNGQVIEQGTHNELINNDKGSYASLVKRQMEAEENLSGIDK